jgi:D-glycero-D-manno-heptose 1,7-bisphosphate phosphatase
VDVVDKMQICRIKAVFIDRDGTINQEKEYVNRIEDFELIAGSLEALKLLTQYGIKIYIITNQAGIAKGFFTMDQFHHLTEHMIHYFESEGIKVEEVLYCPHHPDGIVPEYTKDCLCRKPNNKLIKDTIEENDFKADELVLIGDKNSDIEAGKSLGITTYLVETGYGAGEKYKTNATFVKKNLEDAVVHMLNIEEKVESHESISKGKV